MIRSKEAFLRKLEQELSFHPDCREIVAEYQSHLEEIIHERTFEMEDEQQIMSSVVERLGSPEEIASMWKEEAKVHPEKTSWMFVIINITLFLGGGLLTFIYHAFEWTWADALWLYLTDIPFLIILLYIGFWVFLGYEMGKEFGYQGKHLLKKTFTLALVPNLVLMALTVLRMIPYHWFSPLLNTPFIVTCIVLTALLYPICWMAYYWGRRASV